MRSKLHKFKCVWKYRDPLDRQTQLKSLLSPLRSLVVKICMYITTKPFSLNIKNRKGHTRRKSKHKQNIDIHQGEQKISNLGGDFP